MHRVAGHQHRATPLYQSGGYIKVKGPDGRLMVREIRIHFYNADKKEITPVGTITDTLKRNVQEVVQDAYDNRIGRSNDRRTTRGAPLHEAQGLSSKGFHVSGRAKPMQLDRSDKAPYKQMERRVLDCVNGLMPNLSDLPPLQERPSAHSVSLDLRSRGHDHFRSDRELNFSDSNSDSAPVSHNRRKPKANVRHRARRPHQHTVETLSDPGTTRHNPWQRTVTSASDGFQSSSSEDSSSYSGSRRSSGEGRDFEQYLVPSHQTRTATPTGRHSQSDSDNPQRSHIQPDGRLTPSRRLEPDEGHPLSESWVSSENANSSDSNRRPVRGAPSRVPGHAHQSRRMNPRREPTPTTEHRREERLSDQHAEAQRRLRAGGTSASRHALRQSPHMQAHPEHTPTEPRRAAPRRSQVAVNSSDLYGSS